MHGVKRVQYTQAALEAKKERDKAKLKDYLALADVVISRKKSHDLSKEAFELTTQLLRINAEFYTVWNYRRIIFTTSLFPQSSPSDVNEYLSDDLSLTFGLLKEYPKVYWIWNHRRWCLERIPDGPLPEDVDGWRNATWKKELFVVEKMLEADARNFHAWNYRRYILTTMTSPPSPKSDLAYTTRKIESNFSNFSAWHQRSKVLQTLWESGELDRAKSTEDEFELVRNAMYTDPDDQSVWIYHAWLVGEGNDVSRVQSEITSIEELLEEQPDSKWCMESLVRYKRILVIKHAATVGKEAVQSLVNGCLELLEKLRTIDPPRRRRYEEIAEEIKSGH